MNPEERRREAIRLIPPPLATLPGPVPARRYTPGLPLLLPLPGVGASKALRPAHDLLEVSPSEPGPLGSVGAPFTSPLVTLVSS